MLLLIVALTVVIVAIVFVVLGADVFDVVAMVPVCWLFVVCCLLFIVSCWLFYLLLLLLFIVTCWLFYLLLLVAVGLAVVVGGVFSRLLFVVVSF